MKATLILVENDADLAEAQALVVSLMASDDPGDLARMRAQARLVADYEETRWPRGRVSIPDLLTHLLDQHGMTRRDLVPLLGTTSRVSEVMSGKKALSLSMVRRLRARFGIPADLLIPVAGDAPAHAA